MVWLIIVFEGCRAIRVILAHEHRRALTLSAYKRAIDPDVFVLEAVTLARLWDTVSQVCDSEVILISDDR